MISPDDFGKFIAVKRKELKMSQVVLAEKLNIDPKTLSKWENGIGYPDLEAAYKIAEIFNISLIDILNEEFDSEIIEDKKFLTFDNIFIAILILISTVFVVIKLLNIMHISMKAPILLSAVFLANTISLICLIINKRKTNTKMLNIFTKIICFVTALILFIL